MSLGSPGEISDPMGDVELTRQLVLERLKGESVQVWLFGSRVWGQPVRSSDIDVGILPLGELRPTIFIELLEALEQSPIRPIVELFDLRRVDPALRRRVLDHGVPWKK
ncbi:MAG: nucleotidyltransferase domain-containing protein [Deltaproteobacteria bacterium]